MALKNRLESKLNDFLSLEEEFHGLLELQELAEKDDEVSIIDEIFKDSLVLKEKVLNKEIETLLSGKVDSNDCYLEINAGAGGTESQDWASMLLRMYSRWVENKGFNSSFLELSDGDEAGIKSASIKISGENAYGFLKSESGVHRLVRISPFDTQKRRHTSFASVWVYPSIDKSIKINIDEKDIRLDSMLIRLIAQLE